MLHDCGISWVSSLNIVSIPSTSQFKDKYTSGGHLGCCLEFLQEERQLDSEGECLGYKNQSRKKALNHILPLRANSFL